MDQDTLDYLRGRQEHAKKAGAPGMTIDTDWFGQLLDLVERQRVALEFYADPFGKDVPVPDFYSELDFGSRAREALKQA